MSGWVGGWAGRGAFSRFLLSPVWNTWLTPTPPEPWERGIRATVAPSGTCRRTGTVVRRGVEGLGGWGRAAVRLVGSHLVVLQRVEAFPATLDHGGDIIIRQGQVTCLA